MAKYIKERTKKQDLSPLLYGKLPPQAPDLEGAVLGALMLEPAKLYVVFPIITTHDIFYSDANQRIYASIRRLYDKGTMIDFMTVCEDLRKNSELERVGGSYYVTLLTRDVVSSAHVEEHARIVVQKYILRELIRIGGSVVGDAYEDSMDALELIQTVESKFIELNYTITGGAYKSLSSILTKVMDGIFKPKDTDCEIKTGIREWDNAMGGNFQPGTLGVGAARPGVGKTTAAIEIVLDQSKKDDIGFWNGELTEDRLVKRFLCNLGRIPYRYLIAKKGVKIPDDIEAKISDAHTELLSNHKIHLNNTPNILIHDLIAIIRYWVAVKGVKMVWLDYLRYIELPDTPKFHYMAPEKQKDYIMQQLLKCSKDCGIPIILLHQLNREAGKRTDKTPQLGDLRDSGAIEEIASFVFFLHRPEQYNIMEDEQGRSTKNITEIILAKNSDGISNVKFRMLNDSEFFSMKEEYYEPILKTEIADSLPF